MLHIIRRVRGLLRMRGLLRQLLRELGQHRHHVGVGWCLVTKVLPSIRIAGHGQAANHCFGRMFQRKGGTEISCEGKLLVDTVWLPLFHQQGAGDTSFGTVAVI